LIVFVVVLLAVAVIAEAQQPSKIPRIGYLGAFTPSAGAPLLEAFRQGMRELGYVEGRNIFIDYRWAEGIPDRFPALADELINLRVDVIVTQSNAATATLQQATRTIPIVVAAMGDPVGSGFVASLARPGANITGFSNESELATLSPEISGKQLEFLREIAPKVSRVAVLGNASRPGTPQALREINVAADAFGVQVQYLEIRDPKDIETAFRDASKERADAVLVLGAPVLTTQRKQVIELAAKSRLPTIYGRPEYVEDGGLVFYGPSYTDLFRRAATYVDKILKGAKPADLPIEQPTKFEFVVNLKAAKQMA
jgi:ABC-type uncharacterized transport system substrate-binding protein